VSFESKYVSQSSAVPMLLERLAACCRVDAEYPANRVHSVYFDSPDLRAMAEVDNGDFHKAKVRVRWYEEMDGSRSGAFLECKRKVGVRRVKARYPLPDLEVSLPLHHPRWIEVPRNLLADGAELPGGLLQPTLHITYTRHRFVEPLSGLRLALDAQLRAARVHPRFARSGAIAGRPAPVAVFEAKGDTRRLPETLRFVRSFGARRRAFSKYGLWNELLT
jgi:hypothetical protein